MVANKLATAILTEVILFAIALGAIFLYTLPVVTGQQSVDCIFTDTI